MLPDLESLSTSNSNVSTSSPFPSRPETPSDAVNKFLNLSAAGIDKVLRSRLPHRQSITIKHQQPPTSFPVTTEPPSEDAATVVKSVVPISPSKKLIQNARLSTSRQKFKSTQNLVTVPLTAFKTEEERNDQGIQTSPRAFYATCEAACLKLRARPQQLACSAPLRGIPLGIVLPCRRPSPVPSGSFFGGWYGFAGVLCIPFYLCALFLSWFCVASAGYADLLFLLSHTFLLKI